MDVLVERETLVLADRVVQDLAGLVLNDGIAHDRDLCPLRLGATYKALFIRPCGTQWRPLLCTQVAAEAERKNDEVAHRSKI